MTQNTLCTCLSSVLNTILFYTQCVCSLEDCCFYKTECFAYIACIKNDIKHKLQTMVKSLMTYTANISFWWTMLFREKSIKGKTIILYTYCYFNFYARCVTAARCYYWLLLTLLAYHDPAMVQRLRGCSVSVMSRCQGPGLGSHEPGARGCSAAQLWLWVMNLAVTPTIGEMRWQEKCSVENLHQWVCWSFQKLMIKCQRMTRLGKNMKR